MMTAILMASHKLSPSVLCRRHQYVTNVIIVNLNRRISDKTVSDCDKKSTSDHNFYIVVIPYMIVYIGTFTLTSTKVCSPPQFSSSSGKLLKISLSLALYVNLTYVLFENTIQYDAEMEN